MIVSPRRVKDAPFTMLTHPCPRLGSFIVSTLGQYHTVGIVFGVNVGLIPALDRRETLQDGVIRLDDGLLEDARAVTLELRADQFDVGPVIQNRGHHLGAYRAGGPLDDSEGPVAGGHSAALFDSDNVSSQKCRIKFLTSTAIRRESPWMTCWDTRARDIHIKQPGSLLYASGSISCEIASNKSRRLQGFYYQKHHCF